MTPERAREPVYGERDQAGATSGSMVFLARWSWWLRWAVVSAVGWVAGHVVREIVGLPGGGVAAGAVVGGMQWLLLRARTRQAGWWVLASAAGAGLTGLAVENLLVDTGLLDRLWLLSWGAGVLVAGGMAGAVVGAAQWFVLRRWVQRAGWWVLASGVGFALGDGFAEVFAARSTFLDVMANGMVCEMLRGLVLAWLLQNPRVAESPYGEEPW